MAHRRSNKDGARGQGVAEFAIVLPVLALILLSILQIAFVIGSQIGLTNATREAARIASVTATTTASEATSNGNAVLIRLRTTLMPTNVMNFSLAQLDAGDCTSGSENGTRITYTATTDVSGAPAVFVRVDVVYRHPMFIPIIGGILDGIDGTPNDGFRVGGSEELRVDNVGLEGPLDFVQVCLP
jgi:Flp pilus assembly protein TadG